MLRRVFDRTTLIFFVLAVASAALVWILKGSATVYASLWHGAELLLKILPQLVAGLTIGAFVQVLISKEMIASRLEGSTALTGPLIAMLAGALTPSGPFVAFPLALALWRADAEVGIIIAYITGWALVGVERAIVWELPLMGPEFTALRYVVCLPGPLLAALIARQIAARTRLADDRGGSGA